MKNFKLFNQSFGTVGSPNQTGETLTRENRVGLMSYLRRTLMLLFAVLTLNMANIGMAWGEDITITPTYNNNYTTMPYGLVNVIGSVKANSSGVYSAGSNGGTYTLTFTTTKSDMYIKSVTFNSVSNGTLSSSDGTITSSVFTASGSKTSVTITMTSNSSKKGSCKITNVVVNAGSNTVETHTAFSVSSSTVSSTAKIDGSSVTSAVSMTTTGSASDGKLSIPNNGTITFTSSSNILYIAFFNPDNKILQSNQFQVNSTKLATGAWSGSAKTVEVSNKTGAARDISHIWVITEAAAAKDYTVTATVSGGVGGTVSAAASSLDATETTTITATPASGYQVTNWAVSGTGASVSPSGASNSNTTTLTMGTANATVTVTFGLIDYAVTKTLTNCAVKDGSTAIPSTMNYGDDLSTIIEPTSGNLLPSSITVSGVTSYTWNALTGALTLTDVTGAVSISISAGSPQTGSGATVTYAMVTSGSTAATYSTGVFTGILSGGSSNKNTLVASNTLSGGNGVGVQSKKTTPSNSYTAGITSSTSAFDAASTPYVQFSFDVVDGYTFTPTGISVPVQPISNNAYFKILVTDGSSTWTTTSSECTAGSKTTITTAPTGGSALSGTVNVKVYCYSQATSAAGYRFATPVTVTGTVASAAPACTAPNHVDISGTWGRFGGEDISLTAAAYSSAGTGSPIADANITGWQWQKLIGSTWTNVSNGTSAGVTTSGATSKNLVISGCGQGNSGKYRCVVSTGATCSTPSATATDGSEGYGVKVYTLECYTGGTTTYNFTRDGNNERGSVEVDLAARAEGHEFKIHADDYYGNDGDIYEDEDDWTFTTAGNNVTVHPGLGGTFTFTIDYSSNGAVPVLEVMYPRKTVYLVPNSDWKTDNAKFAFNYFRSGGSGGWTSFLSTSVCDAAVYPAEIPQWDGVQIIGVRFDPSKVSTGNWDDKWNQTQDLTLSSNDKVAISDWNSATYNSNYAAPTYTISFAGNGSSSGSMSDIEDIACDADKTITANAFSKTGYSFAGWKANVDVKINGSTVSAGTVISDKVTIQNIRSNITLTAQWNVNSYNLTWNLGGGTTTSAGTGIASGVSVNTTSSVAYGTSLTAPTVTKANYDFSAWSPSVAKTMPAAATTYTATWTAKKYNVSTSLTHVTVSSGTTGSNAATYGTNYSVSFAADGGYIFPSDITVTIGGVAKTKGTHYTWNSSTGALVVTGSYITGDIVVTITALEDVYTVTYTANGGSGSVPTDATSYDSGDEVTVKGKNTLSKTGYTFTGWSDGTTFFEEGNKFNITGNKSLAAVWEPTNSCTTTLADVNFKSSSWSGKTFSQGNTTTSDQINGLYFYSKNSDAAKQFSLSSNTSNGLTFPNNNFASGNYYLCIPLQSGDINGKITVTIKHGYSSATASYKYYFWDGATSYTDGYTNGSGGTQVTDASSSDTEITFEVTASNANHKGYLYIGRQSSSYTQIYGVTVTTPCPTSTSKTVTFNKGSNPAPASPSNIPAQKTVPYNHKILRPATDPSASNYIFNGWVTTSGGSTSFDFANTSITSNTTIYAKWTAKTAPTQYTFSLSDPCASASPSATLSGSQSGWSYQLYKNGAVSGDPKAGTGNALTWTGLTAGSYYVKTVETPTQASAQIGSSAAVYAGTTITSNLSSSRSVNANVSTTVSITATGASLTYQWYTCNSDGTGKVAVDGKTTNSFAYTFTNEDAPTKYICCVVTGTCGMQTSNIQTVTINRTYYLTVDLDGGSWSGGISSGYRTVSTFNIPTPIPTKSGYVFLGWSFLGNTYQPGAAITPNQTATLRALWASPCFSVSDASKKTMPDGQPAGTVITGGGMINGTITGGTLTYTGTDAAGLNGNAKGLIFNNDNDELTVNITDGMLQEGTVIVIGSYGTASSSSHTNGLKVSGNNMSPATVVSSTSNNSISQRYVVADGDGIEGTSSFTIRRVASTDQMMLNTISVAGCQSCTAITPTLSYSSTTLYAFGGMPRGAVPTLTGNTGNGAVSYSSSNTNVVTVDSETGVVTAVGCGSATVSAIIEPNGGYCGAVRSVNFTVPALVTQTIRVGTSTSWNGDGSAAPDMSFNDPTSTTSQVAVIANSGYTFDATTASDKANMTRKFTGTETTKGAKYVTLKFKNATHNLRLGEVIARIQPVTSNGKAQVEIYEGSTLRLTSSEVTGITQGQLNDVRFTFASPYVFAANTNIEVRLYFYGQTDGFRLGTPFYVNGGVLVDQRFTDANSTGLWSDPANWDGGALPEIYHDVILQKPCSVDIAHATAKSIVIDQNSKTGKLTIGPNKGLEVAETVRKTTDGSSYSGTGEADLVLESSSAGNASLIFNNNNHCQATVQMYSKASVEGNTWNWQYVGTPFENEIPLYNYYGGYMYKWNGTGWDVVHGTDELTPFAGYCLTQASPTTHYMSGELIATDGNDYSVTISSADKDMVLANSWTAPISICSFTASTFTSTPATIYLFNTGSAENGSSEGEAAGTYITVPINSAMYTGNGLIAPMQGFFVTTNDGTAGKITMKYNELVRTTTNHTDIVAGPMKSPTRERVDYGEPDVMKIRVNGSTYMDRVIILAREDFSEGFDNGWDGEKKGYNSAAPAVFVINEEGKNDAVSAIPEYEGTLVGFRAGSEDNVYTMTFEYNGDEVLYLNDLKAQMSAEIANGQTYMFTTEDGDSEVRFIISHNPIRRITTGVDDVETGTKARKVLINEKIYIIRKGRVYSVDGQIVK